MASLEEILTKKSDSRLALELGWSRSTFHDQSIAASEPRALIGIVDQFSITTHKSNLFRLTMKVKNAILVYDMSFEALNEYFNDTENQSKSITDNFAGEIEDVIKRYERSQWLSDQDSGLYLCWLDNDEDKERFARSLEEKNEDTIREYTRNTINVLGAVLQKTRELNAWSGLLAHVELVGRVPSESHEPQQSATESEFSATLGENHEQINAS